MMAIVGILLLAACSVSPAVPTLQATQPVTQMPSPGAEMAVATPVQQQEFELPPNELQAQVSFSLLGLTFVPAGLTDGDSANVKTFADGSQSVEMTYHAADLNSGDARELGFTQSNLQLDLEGWFRVLELPTADNIRPTSVRGSSAYFYATRPGEPGLFWQENGLAYDLRLAGAGWPGAVSDDLLLWMAESLQAGDTANFTYQHRAPQTWLSYTSSTYQFSFAVPREWQQTGDVVFDGDNGFARLETYRGFGARLDQACEMEANLHPERYGAQPTLRSIPQQWNSLDVEDDPCLILPGANAPADALATLLLPDPTQPGQAAFLRLTLDPPHAEMIAFSLDLPHVILTSTAIPLATPDPASIPTQIEPAVTQLGPLTMENYPIAPISLDWPGNSEFAGRIPASVLEKRASLRTASAEELPTSATSAGRVITVEEDTRSTTHIDAVIKVDGQEVYRYAMLPRGGPSRIYGVWNWAGRWVLEANGALVVEGELYNQKAGFQEIFNFSLLEGKPFFFFVQNGKTGIFYDGSTWPAQFDAVYHGACCQPAVANPRANDVMIWFYAQQQSWWDYVELGIFTQPSP
ncbi:hypothetical protein LARV_00241 [Longilinea arvoryzae]|uniref:Uncharacterized protein n=2 Tax=Longilinea arvoryzae TaxID=360412 RepID=A0A0S7BBN0_9CHLR|nr:hypothetical protein LARV_00241 [Longilinea arvoryzae]